MKENSKKKTIRILVRDSIHISQPIDHALKYLKNLNNIENYEPKVDQAQVTLLNSTEGRYLAHGRFMGLPWQGSFSFRLTKQGFDSELIGNTKTLGFQNAARIRGGYRVKSKGVKQCDVFHWEEYLIPRWNFVFTPFLKFYLKRSIRQELALVRTNILSLEKKNHEGALLSRVG